MKLSDYTLSLLADIENRIDPGIEEDFLRQWEDFWSGNCKDIIFRAKRKKIVTAGVEPRRILMNDAIDDYELMLDRELATVSDRLASETAALGVRASYGTGIMTSLFGAEIFMMDREKNMLPTTKSLNDTDAMYRIVEAGMPDLLNGFGKKVFEMGEFFAEVFRDYPKIQKYVQIYHPDTQGPLDIAELLWGSEMFYAMYDEPEFVHDAIRLITDTYKSFLDKWFAMIPYQKMNVHFNWMHPGKILIRNDSAMNLSPELYDEFAFPYDNELLDYYDGGCVHFCGRGDHYIDRLTTAKKLYGINMSQPHLNNMEIIYAAMLRNGKKFVGMYKAGCDAYEKRADAVPGIMNHQDW